MVAGQRPRFPFQRRGDAGAADDGAVEIEDDVDEVTGCRQPRGAVGAATASSAEPLRAQVGGTTGAQRRLSVLRVGSAKHPSPADDGDARSEASRATSTAASRLGSRALARFRRAVADRRGDAAISFRGLKMLAWLGWGLLALFTVSSSVSTIFVGRAFADFESNLIFANAVGVNAIYLSIIMVRK